MRHAQTLNEAQFRKVLHYCRTRRHANRDMTIFMVSFFAGLRAKEIAALRLGDVFDAEGLPDLYVSHEWRLLAHMYANESTAQSS